MGGGWVVVGGGGGVTQHSITYPNVDDESGIS